MNTKYRIYDILWDTDGDKKLLKTLPSCLIIDTKNLDIDPDADEEDIADAISDYLSKKFQFCHSGFEMEMYKNG